MLLTGFRLVDVRADGTKKDFTNTTIVFDSGYDNSNYDYFTLHNYDRRKEWYLFDGEELEDLNRIIKPSGLIERVIFNPPATIVFWKDGTKTVAKAENEPFDAEKGFAMAVAKKFLTSKDYHRIMASAKDYRESVCIDNGGCQIEKGD